MRVFLFLVLLLTASIACNTSISQQVPAVVGNGGSLVNVTVELIPGDGQIYVSVFPRTGVNTQQSIESAVGYAKIISNSKENCDVIIKFAEDDASYIEGPSAGTALTVMSYAALENKTLRNDTIITGTIEYNGEVGPVGGLYEKAKEAARAGAKYFITPTENFYEMLILKNVESEYGIEIIEAKHISDVIGFMIENKTIKQENISSRAREIPELTEYDDSKMPKFDQISSTMVDLEKDVVSSIGDDNKDIRDFFENEVIRQRSLIEQGYMFSAANEAFLNLIDLSTISAILNDNVDLPRKKGDISICLSRISTPEITDENFEWVVGSDLRFQWAEDKLDVDIESPELQEEKFVVYNDLMYGHAWCHVANELSNAAPREGTVIEQGDWKELAEQKISEARSLSPTGALASRLSIAEDSYSKELYGAAIFDSVYVIKTIEADTNLAENFEVEDEVIELLDQQRTSLWANVYQSHGAFLYELNESVPAYRTLVYAEGLEQAVLEMDDLIVERSEEIEETDDMIVVFVATISMFLLFVLLILIARRVNGNKRDRKTYRPKQKKGRT
ncbi:MAG: S16 family serine protease [Candidatus Micrarchaeota archaeon]